MPAHGVLHYFVILSSAEKYANAWILMRPFSVAVKGFQVEGELAHVLRFEATSFQLKGNEAL